MKEVALMFCATVLFSVLLWWGARSGTIALGAGNVSRARRPMLYNFAKAILAGWIGLFALATIVAIARI
ncbi:hypothetical protein MZO42_11075 [Sphingomonas psychrotolerans]|uniref:Uncharacterized protein n=1 Tax=Sphingomonas psychrotolerans TaxID=1327635 RepID=A0ABU3N3X8_9SPHN|nr:hypothetical protein [Sphingomonas psychrotolerans]MDT8759239.1 hypothetical protein [Sphingomonas psychrotolerans]